MNGRQLLEALGTVDPKYVEEAETALPVRRKLPVFAALAACLCLVVLMTWGSPWLNDRNQVSCGEEQNQNTQIFDCVHNNSAPEESLVVLRVEALTEDGFFGTEILRDGISLGASWRVILPEETRGEGTAHLLPEAGTLVTIEVTSRKDEDRVLVGEIVETGEISPTQERSNP